MNGIDGFISDPGNNIRVGHRILMLHPNLAAISVGAVSYAVGRREVMAVNVIKNMLSSPRGTRDGVISWPPAGFFPYRLLPPSRRWHYWPYSSKMVFTNAAVTVTGPTGLVTGVKVVFRGDPNDTRFRYIVFEVPTMSLSTLDRIYTVVISGITGDTESMVTYQVIIINI